MKSCILFFLLLIQMAANAQQKATISGFVEGAANRERLPGANVIAGPNTGVATNSYGFYSLTLPTGNYKLICRYVGYKSVTKQFVLVNDTAINFQLPLGIELEEIEVKANRLD